MFCQSNQKSPASFAPVPQLSKKSRNGFSLVLALSVMSMVLLTVLSLTAFLTVQLRLSESSKMRMLARQNALVGARVALGQLQAMMGPDRRVSAPATITEYEDPDGTRKTEPDAYKSDLANSQWVGVWDTWDIKTQMPYYGFGVDKNGSDLFMSDTRNTGAGYKRPASRGWLVSHRKEDLENADFGPKSALGAGDVVLESVVLHNYHERLEASAGEKREVRAPYVPIETAGGKSGLGGFAYWISDESTKARFNLNDVFKKKTDNESRAKRISAPVFANITNVKSVGQNADIRMPYTKFEENASVRSAGDAVDLKTVAFFLGSNTDWRDKESVLKENFLDLTTSSSGLLVNTVRGGFLSDLTAFLHSDGNIPPDEYGNLGLSKDDQIIRSGKYVKTSPRFGAIKAWYDFRKEGGWPKLNNVISGTAKVSIKLPERATEGDFTDMQKFQEPIPPKVPKFDYQPRTPVLVDAFAQFNFAAYDRSNKGGNGFGLKTYVYPRIALWNPYNYTIQAERYRVVLYGPVSNALYVKAASNGMTYKASKTKLAVGSTVGSNGKDHILFGSHLFGIEQSTRTDERTDQNLSNGCFFVFTLDSDGADIPPGKVLYFSAPEGFTQLDYGKEMILSAKNPPDAGAFCHEIPCDFVNFTLEGSKIKEIRYFDNPTNGGDEYGYYRTQYAVSEDNISSPKGEMNPIRYDYTGAVLTKAEGKVSANVKNETVVQRLNTSFVGERGKYNKERERDRTNDFNGIKAGSRLFLSSSYEANVPPEPPGEWQFGPRFLHVNEQDVGRAFSHKNESDLFPNYVYRIPYFFYNLRSPLVLRNPASYHQVAKNSLTSAPYFWPRTRPRFTLNDHAPFYQDGLYWGSPFGPNTKWNDKGASQIVLFDLPLADVPVLSIGNFRHVLLSPFVWSPTYVVGNGNAHISCDPDKTVAYERIIKQSGGNAGSLWDPVFSPELDENWLTNENYVKNLLGGVETELGAVSDISFVANNELFDNFYLSGLITNPGDNKSQWDWQKHEPLANARLILNTQKHNYETKAGEIVKDLEKMYHESAGVLSNEGAFNVNSTSVEAWRAFLSLMLKVPRFIQSKSMLEVEKAIYSRNFVPADAGEGGNANPADNLITHTMWAGFRSLDSDKIEKLAKQIVIEVKKRGPFLSLSDFINRRLIGTGVAVNLPDREIPEPAKRGTIDAAIENAEINKMAYQTYTKFPVTANDPVNEDDNDYIDVRKETKSKTAAYDGYALQYKQMMPSWQSSGAPGCLTQHDILQVTAPAMTVRGDTFTIRAYGDYKNPVSGSTESKAFLEMVVQRTPEYVDSGDAAEKPFFKATKTDQKITLEKGDLENINRLLGRRFVITALRWITSDDI